MTKKEMLMQLPMEHTPVYDEYRAEGYTPEGAAEKTLNWYMQNYTQPEIEDMYNEYYEG